MQNVGYKEVIERFTSLLRNKVSDPAERGSDKAESFTGDGSTKEFSLGNKLLTNVYSVKVGGVDKLEFIDFNIRYDDPADATSFPSIVFEGAPASDASIEVSYHVGETWVYQAFPEEEFEGPRISLFHISSREEAFALGLLETPTIKGLKQITWLQIDVWTKKGQVYTISGEKYSGNKLKDWIADRIMGVIGSNRLLLKNQGFESVILRMSRDMDYERGTGLFRKVLDIEVVHTMRIE